MKKMSRYACLRRALAAGAFSIGIALVAVPASAQIGSIRRITRRTS